VRRHLPRVILLAAALLAWPALGGGPSARAAAYDRFYANFAGEELMRAINADRASLGLASLASDSTLESVARDRAIACPTNGNLTIRGRARDMADRNYLGHTIPGCTTSSGGAFDTFDLLRAFGYSYAGAAENVADNNYPAGATTYATGCGLNGTGCHGSTTLPQTVAVAERAFMSSSQHRANLLSTGYGRFGCGAWASSSGYRYYSCYFVASGNGTLDSTGPAIGSKSGVGAVFAAGSTPSFTASASDGHSVLSDGWAAIDGVHIRNWAWDHAGSTSAMSATAPSLKPGSHTFTWWVRDASTHATTTSFHFSVGSSGGGTPTPPPTATATAGPTSRPSGRPTGGPTARPSSAPAASLGVPSTSASGLTGSVPASAGGDTLESPNRGVSGPALGGPRSPTSATGGAAGVGTPGAFVLLAALMVGWTVAVIAFGSARLRTAIGGAVSRRSGGGEPGPQ
jgi:uncharacterized protein YkwD